jgi:hypothetical protein
MRIISALPPVSTILQSTNLFSIIPSFHHSRSYFRMPALQHAFSIIPLFHHSIVPMIGMKPVL